MNAYGGVDVQIQVFLTSALVDDGWSPSRPGRFTRGERAPRIYWIGDCLGPRTDNIYISFKVSSSPFRVLVSYSVP
jgi:hypothetical protein